jgi:hypothetical protein
VTDVALGYQHACALVDSTFDSSGGDVYCWGANHYGQLGQGNVNITNEGANPPRISTPVRAKNLGKAIALYEGYHSTCAMTVDLQILCWGYNSDFMFAVDPANLAWYYKPPTKVPVTALPWPSALTDVCA